MNISAKITDERVADVRCTDDDLVVDLMDGRTISVPLAWYPRLLKATTEQRAQWEKSAAGYGIHWPAMCQFRQRSSRSGQWPTARPAA